MGSRLKENPERTFYWFFEASCPIAKDKDPEVLFQFPEDFSDEESLQSLPRFCFPYDVERVKVNVAVQHFAFVLTDLEGCQRFGFCRLTSSSRTCLCILSYLPWFEVFYKLLNNLADYLTKGQTNEMRELLLALYRHPVPKADSSVTLHLIPYFVAPDPRCLPSIPESRNLTELVVAVDVNNLLELYASMLFERRILIISSKLSTLTACVHACSAVLYPMYWQHIFIPVLPPHLLDYCWWDRLTSSPPRPSHSHLSFLLLHSINNLSLILSLFSSLTFIISPSHSCSAPMPYLIGVHSSLSERMRSRGLEDVVILNVDTNTIESTFDDLKRIPSDVVTALKTRLKKQSATSGSGVARAFLRAQSLLFGGYRDALLCTAEGGPIRFREESFLNHKSNSMRQFLESAVHLQFFKQFIDERLELLNSGQEPSDLFEEELSQCGSSVATKSYQQWMGNLKKGGGALIHTVKSKASMCKSAKSHGKSGPRNILYANEETEAAMLYRVGSLRTEPSGKHQYRRVRSDCLQSRLPITQHFGKSRPRRPTRRYTEQQVGAPDQICSLNPAWDLDFNGAMDSEQCSGDGAHLEEPEDLLPGPEDMDLLGEIFDTLSTRSSHERGLLYGTRSLDLFGPDSADYITRRNMATPSQESLSVSPGGSESLLSWGQEERLDEGLDQGLEEGPVNCLEKGFEDSFGEWLNKGLEKEPVNSLEEGQENRLGEGLNEGMEKGDRPVDGQDKGIDRDQEDKGGKEESREDVPHESTELLENSPCKTSQTPPTRVTVSPGRSSPASPSTGVFWEASTTREDQLERGSHVESLSIANQNNGEKSISKTSFPSTLPTTEPCGTPEPACPGTVVEEGDKSFTSGLQGAMAPFPVRASQPAPLKKSANVWWAGDPSLRNAPLASLNGKPSFMVTQQTTRHLVNPLGTPPAEVTTEAGTSTEEKDLPPVKVSELKRRFEKI